MAADTVPLDSPDSSLLSPVDGSRRQTADLQELQALLNDDKVMEGVDAPAGPSRDSLTTGDKTARLSRVRALLEESSRVSDPSKSSIDAEETVALQDLLHVSQQIEESKDSSAMSISHDSDSSLLTGALSLPRESGESRRNTIGLGEVQARLMQELNEYERRSSMFTQTTSRLDATTQTLPTDRLMDLLKEEGGESLDSTLELQQYAEELRMERREEELRRKEETLQTETKNKSHEEQDTTERTDEILRRMRASTTSEAVEQFDATVTEDLKRLSELLEKTKESEHVSEDSIQGGEEPTHTSRFSPLVVKSGMKQVLHSVKSNQKYAKQVDEKVRVIDAMTPKPLFQEEEKEVTLSVTPTPALPTETSLNLDQYFLPSKTQSSLNDSITNSPSLPLVSSESSTMESVIAATPSTPSVPEPTVSPIRAPEPTVSPIRAPEPTVSPIRAPEPTVSPIRAPHSALEEPSLSPVEGSEGEGPIQPSKPEKKSIQPSKPEKKSIQPSKPEKKPVVLSASVRQKRDRILSFNHVGKSEWREV